MARGRLAVRCGSNRAARPSLQQNAMTPLLALHAATPTLPVRWDATLLGGGWRGSPEDDLLPAVGLLVDAGFDGAVALEGTRRFVVDHRRLVRGPAAATSALVADLVARVERGNPETPTGWCERAAVFAPDAVTEELVELGLVEYREAGWLHKAVRYKAFEILDVGAREAAATRVRDAVARPAHAPESAVALALLLRATGMLRSVAGASAARNERALEARRATLPPLVAAVLETLDARRRRLDAVGP